ncbi:MAG: AAA family ATPase [Candidatus Thorarchaeota archaeon]
MKAFQITNIQLENIKTYVREEINFSEGNNVLIGENGAGKSTILESIYLSFFGDTVPGRNLVDMIRLGERQGRIITKFTVDGINYRIEDEITKLEETRAAQKQVLFNETDEETIAEGRNAVNAKIEEIMGVDATTFISAVYASQGEIGSIVTAKDKDRKRLFDRLFQIDRYEKAWQNLSKVEKIIKNEISLLEERVSNYTEDIKGLPELREKITEKNNQLLSETKELSKLQKEFENLDGKYKQTKNLMIKYTELIAAKKTLEQDILSLKESIQNELNAIKDEISITAIPKTIEPLTKIEKNWTQEQLKSKKERDKLVETEKSILLKLQSIKSKKQNLGTLQENINNINTQMKKEIEEFIAKVPELGEDIQVWKETCLNIEEEKKNQLAKVKSEVKGLEKISVKLSSQKEKIEEKESAIIKIDSRIFDKRLKLSQSAGDNWQEEIKRLAAIDFEKNLAQLSADLEKLEEIYSQTNSEKSSIETNLERIKGDLQHLEELKGKETCPTCKQELSAKTLEQLQKDLNKEKENYSIQKNEIVKKSSEITSKIDQAKKNHKKFTEENSLYQKIKPYFEDLQELDKDKLQIEEEQAKLKKEISNLEKQYSSDTLEKLNEQIDELEEILATVKNAKNAVQRLTNNKQIVEDETIKVKALVQEIKDLQKEASEEELTKTKEQITSLEEKINSLQEKIGVVRGITREYENKITKEEKLVETTNEISQLEINQDLKTFETLEENWQKTNDTIIAKKSSVKFLKEETIPLMKEQIQGLENKEKQLEKNILQLTSEKKKEIITGILRNLMRELPNKLLPNYIEKVSHVATEILQSIMPESDIQSIMINSDYSLQIVRLGNIEDISVLSGGETIIIALALRLAFAKEFSSLDTLILDEPTIFLDERRRGELVSVLEKNRLVGQMFVVTHDPDFERISDQTFIVNKERGETSIRQINTEQRNENLLTVFDDKEL